MGALIQDEVGTWYYFSCGQEYVTFITVDNNFLTDLETFSKEYYYQTSLGMYTTSTYISGDFSKTFEYFTNYAKSIIPTFNETGTIEFNPQYDMVTNNCAQMVLKGIELGSLNDGTSVKSFLKGVNGLIPNICKNQIKNAFYNNAFTHEEYFKQINDQLSATRNRLEKATTAPTSFYYSPQQVSQYYFDSINLSKLYQ